MGRDIRLVNDRGENCGSLCQQTSECSHFAWNAENGGTCYLKKGYVRKDYAIPATDNMCGIL